jgi:hypothetical protein
MKKSIMLLLTTLACLLSGCFDLSEFDLSEDELNFHKEYSSAFSGETGREISEKILNFISDRDVEGLKNMFSVIITAQPDFEEQIQEAFEFFDGVIISHGYIGGGSGHSGTRRLHVSPFIKDVKTDTEKTYHVQFNMLIIHTEHPDRVGISQLRIIDENGEEYVVGDFFLVNLERRR